MPTLADKHFTDLILAVGLVDLDELERRLLEWLAGLAPSWASQVSSATGPGGRARS